MHGLVLTFFALTIALFALQQRQARLRDHVTDMIENENVRLESMVQLRTRELNDLANAREAARNRLARESHDELGALLSEAKMDANWLLRSLGGRADAGIRERFRRLIDSIGAGIRLKRDIIDDLLLPLLQGLGLVEALHALADNFSGDIPVHLEVPPEDTELVEARSLALFRIAHEALTNIRKYANASHVRLGLSLADDQVCIWIKDDGVGFDPNMTTITRYGLAGVKHRVLMFAGGFVPTSAPGKGTRGEARMPAQPGSRHH